jgi:hypothetical protein
MFNPLHTIFFRIDASQRNPTAGLCLAALSWLVLAFNAAGQLHVGVLGLIGIILLFLMLGTVGCYWYIVSIHFLGGCFRKTQPQRLPIEEIDRPWMTALQGLWPLILLGPAISAQQWWPSLGTLMACGSILGSGFTLIVAIRRAYDIHWIQASLCLFLTVILGSLALGGLVGWPVMFLLGSKSFSVVMSV